MVSFYFPKEDSSDEKFRHAGIGEDSNYFSLVFSRKCGISPTDFRKNWRKDTRLALI